MLELTMVNLRDIAGFLARIDHGIFATSQGCSKGIWRVFISGQGGIAFYDCRVQDKSVLCDASTPDWVEEFKTQSVNSNQRFSKQINQVQSVTMNEPQHRLQPFTERVLAMDTQITTYKSQ